MPYIKQERRKELDTKISELFSQTLNVGDLNYIISRIIQENMKQAQNNDMFNYAFCNNIIGVLECAKIEFYNRVVTPYENQKIQENGELY